MFVLCIPIFFIMVTVDEFMWMHAVKTCVWSMFVQMCSLLIAFDFYSCWSNHSYGICVILEQYSRMANKNNPYRVKYILKIKFPLCLIKFYAL